MRFDPFIVTVKQSSIVSQIVSSPVVLSFASPVCRQFVAGTNKTGLPDENGNLECSSFFTLFPASARFELVRNDVGSECQEKA